MTEKPTIFFSHSAPDQDLLAGLKTSFGERTGGVYDVFLSSDGSSIPFGRNWTKTVEDGLERAKLMFVFLTPASVGSPWIYFEAGFAYAKGVRVVPIGIGEVDLTRIPPPLSLLQGYNLRNSDGLNNLLAIVNETFSHSHRLSFDAVDFEQLMTDSHVGPRRALGPLADVIDELRISLIGATHEFKSVQLVKQIAATLSDRGVVHEFEGSVVAIHGATMSASGGSSSPESVDIKIDCLAVESAMPVVLDALTPLPADVRHPSIEVLFLVSVWALHDWHKVTARLIGTAGEFAGGRQLKLGQCKFAVANTLTFGRGDTTQVYLSIEKETSMADLSEIRQIVEFAFSRGLLSVAE